jgi:hypothetical protein
MSFTGIDLHSNRTESCRNEQSSVDGLKGRRIKTFDLNDFGPVQFFKTLTVDTCVLIEAAISTFSLCPAIQEPGERDRHGQGLRIEADFGICAALCPVQRSTSITGAGLSRCRYLLGNNWYRR